MFGFAYVFYAHLDASWLLELCWILQSPLRIGVLKPYSVRHDTIRLRELPSPISIIFSHLQESFVGSSRGAPH